MSTISRRQAMTAGAAAVGAGMLGAGNMAPITGIANAKSPKEQTDKYLTLDTWINVDDICDIEPSVLYEDGVIVEAGIKTVIYRKSRSQFTVDLSVQEVMDKINEAIQKARPGKTALVKFERKYKIDWKTNE